MSIIWNGNQKAGVCHDGGHRHEKAAACENAHSGGNVLCRNHDHLLFLGMTVPGAVYRLRRQGSIVEEIRE